MRANKVGGINDGSKRLRTAHKRAHLRWHDRERRSGLVHVSDVLPDVLAGIGIDPRVLETPGRKRAG
jgi:hypothetical protein